MKIDADDAIEKVCRTILTQVGLGLILVYSIRMLMDGLSTGGLVSYHAFWAVLASFVVGALWAIMSLKIFYSLSHLLDEKFLRKFRPSIATDLARLILNLTVMFLPIVSGYQAFHLVQVLWT